MKKELTTEIVKLVNKYGYIIHHFHLTKDHSDDVLFIEQQKKENILPFLNINDGNNEFRREEWGHEIE